MEQLVIILIGCGVLAFICGLFIYKDLVKSRRHDIETRIRHSSTFIE